MINSADNFKPKKNKLIEHRVQSVLAYFILCYKKVVNDNIKYSYSKRGKIKHEDYLRNRFVDDYLQKNISELNNSTTQYSIINKEANEEYISLIDNVLHNDPIDIQFIDSALKDSWSESYKVYFAIECKRIVKLSDGINYINDTKKFSERSYTQGRLPFEGQIAFVENLNVSANNLYTYINSNLETHNCLVTNDYLTYIKLNSEFTSSYKSTHSKHNSNEFFSVYHLFFDYSKLIENS